MTDFSEYTASEYARMERADEIAEEFAQFGPKCWTCGRGSNFSKEEYPYALAHDVTYCKEWGDLMEDPHTANEDVKDCWRGY